MHGQAIQMRGRLSAVQRVYFYTEMTIKNVAENELDTSQLH